MGNSKARNLANKYVISELEEIKSKEKILVKELDKVKEKEQLLINKINQDLNKEKILSRKAYLEVMHFTFNDFAQATIGSCVFSFAPFLDSDPWAYLPNISTKFLFSIHIFFLICVFIALNYKFRDNFKLDMWFLRLLAKRLFYIYFSVMIVMCLILVMINRLTYQMTTLEAFRNLLTIQTVGLFGATVFSFLKK